MPRRPRAAAEGRQLTLYRRLVAAREGLRGACLASLLAAGLAGCASPGRLDDDGLVTGSVRPTATAWRVPEGAAPRGVVAGDWVQAKLALDQATAAHGKDLSIPWENPETGARGTATPIGAARASGCRDFMISVVDARGDRWVRGEACRSGKGLVLLQVRELGQA